MVVGDVFEHVHQQQQIETSGRTVQGELNPGVFSRATGGDEFRRVAVVPADDTRYRDSRRQLRGKPCIPGADVEDGAQRPQVDVAGQHLQEEFEARQLPWMPLLERMFGNFQQIHGERPD